MQVWGFLLHFFWGYLYKYWQFINRLVSQIHLNSMGMQNYTALQISSCLYTVKSNIFFPWRYLKLVWNLQTRFLYCLNKIIAVGADTEDFFSFNFAPLQIKLAKLSWIYLLLPMGVKLYVGKMRMWADQQPNQNMWTESESWRKM